MRNFDHCEKTSSCYGILCCWPSITTASNVSTYHRLCAGCCSFIHRQVSRFLKLLKNSADQLKGDQFVSVHPLTEQPWHSSCVALAACAAVVGSESTDVIDSLARYSSVQCSIVWCCIVTSSHAAVDTPVTGGRIALKSKVFVISHYCHIIAATTITISATMFMDIVTKSHTDSSRASSDECTQETHQQMTYTNVTSLYFAIPLAFNAPDEGVPPGRSP